MPVPGDLGEPLLGMAIDTFKELSETVDMIVHNGAYVHWIYPYEQLKPVNVLGSHEVLRLATTSKLKPVHYVSTTSVFDSKSYGGSNVVFEEDKLEDCTDLQGGYPQSKWVAEKLMMEARKRGVPVK